MNGIEYYTNEEGKIAVLVSRCFGAGWSTWNREYGVKLALDKRIVEKFLECQKDKELMRRIDSGRTKEEADLVAFLAEIGYPKVYCGGFADIEIEWVEPGTSILITEYDGYEDLHVNYSGYVTL